MRLNPPQNSAHVQRKQCARDANALRLSRHHPVTKLMLTVVEDNTVHGSALTPCRPRLPDTGVIP